MPWTCPACGNAIRHSDKEEMPQIGALYRCHICRLELIMDFATSKLVAVPLDDEADRQPNTKI